MLEAYEAESHYPLLEGWWDAYRIQPTPEHLLPKVGVVYGRKAMGFAYQCEVPVCFIEYLTADPELSKEERSCAIDEVVKALFIEMKARGFELMIAMTNIKAVSERAEALGFLKDDSHYEMLAKAL